MMNILSRPHTLGSVAALLAAASGLHAEQIDFAREVLPILSNKCYACHGPDTQKKKQLRLDSFAAATADRGGYRGIDPKNPTDSEVLIRIHDKDDPMPPEDAEKQLTDAERELLTRWIKEGGKYAKHWAFVPPVKPAPPEGFKGDPKKGAAVVDAFVEARLKEESGGKVAPAPEADRATLARRASITLTGLPPSPERLATYLSDDQPDAYERFVEELMNDPRFGEHQARYWLDAVRYGDTHGLHLDNKRGIFPYRDWVVRALNNNLPLDQFITWQLAGDLLPNATLEQQVATGFVRMNPTTAEGGAIPDEFQCKNNFDRTETLGTVLLGMTMICARCHTHKYDPITHTEYYQLLAFFNSTAESPMDGNKYEYAPVLKVPADQDGWDKLAAWDKRADELLSQFLKKKGSKLDALKSIVDPKSNSGKKHLHPKIQELIKEYEQLQKSFTSTLVAKDLAKPRPTRLLERGEYNRKVGDPLQPDVPSVMGPLPEGAPRNRLGLAQWLTGPDHPLVARVLVNRIWQRVFGEALVRSPEDFGRQGKHPTHPELLDWLAVSLQEQNWDLRAMLRIMVHSRTFKQSSAHRAEFPDPENLFLARGPSYRLDAEVLRDMGLWASNLLDPHMGGEGVKPYQPPGLWKALMHPASNTKHYKKDSGSKPYRRSLYVYWKRTSPHPMMTLFDAPDRESSCVRRSRTNTSLQSLGLLNETQRIEMARKLAERLLTEAKNDSSRLELLFTLVASRAPDDTEREACLGLLKRMRERYDEKPEDAKALLTTGDAGRNEELNAPYVAAWTQVASTVLASDAAILLY